LEETQNCKEGMKVYPYKYCVYYHKIGDVVFYVGSGISSRPFAVDGRTEAWRNYVEDNHDEYIVEIVAWFNTKNQATCFEQKEIRRLNPLTNDGWRSTYWNDRSVSVRDWEQVRRIAFRSHKPMSVVMEGLIANHL
jgi:hypothetical protein